MRYIFLLAIIISIIIASTPKHLITPDKDGLISFVTNISGTDTTYNLFSLYGMRRGVEYELVDTMISRYSRNALEDSMSIEFSGGEVLGISSVETYGNTTLIDFCAYKYFWMEGETQVVAHRCEKH